MQMNALPNPCGSVPSACTQPHVQTECVETMFQNMDSGTKLIAKDATDTKHCQIRHLRDLTPMEEAPDQDSAQKSAKRKKLVCFVEPSNPVGTPKIYTTTGVGPKQNRKIADVDHFSV